MAACFDMDVKMLLFIFGTHLSHALWSCHLLSEKPVGHTRTETVLPLQATQLLPPDSSPRSGLLPSQKVLSQKGHPDKRDLLKGLRIGSQVQDSVSSSHIL